MSVNQSRGDKNEPSQYRRSGRSANLNSPRNFSGGGKGGGGSTTTAPPSSASYSGKSFKKVVSNAQGTHGRGTGLNPNVSSSTGGRGLQNGAHAQASLRGTTDASSTGAPVKSADASVQKSSPGLPKAPQSNVVPPSSGANAPATPVKGSGDASRAFPLQYGSISPGVMNGMQVPARTNSAPPNMDEQKRAQARPDTLKATTFQNPATIPKQHVPRKDVGPVDNLNVNDARPTSKDKKEALPSAPHVTAHSQKPTGLPMPSIPPISMQMPFHQSQIHLPFGGPNPQLQSHPMPNTSLPLPLSMHLPVGNPAQVPPQVFVQHHHHHQGIIHQTQGLPFGNMGMGLGLGPQYRHQQQGPMGNLNFSNARRAVKITHLETHEELQLGKRADGYSNGAASGARPHLHGPSQSQAVPSFSSAGGKGGISDQPHKETIAGSSLPQSEKLTDTSASLTAAIEDSTASVNSASEAANESTVNSSGSFEEEQKQSSEKIQSIPVDKARPDTLKATTFQNPATIPKQHVPRKDVGPVDELNVNEARPTSKDKKEALPSAPHVTAHSQKPTGLSMPSIPPISMQMPFHQSQIHLPLIVCGRKEKTGSLSLVWANMAILNSYLLLRSSGFYQICH